MGGKIFTPFSIELTVSFYRGKSAIQKKTENQNKAAFFAHFYSKIFEFGSE